MTISLISSARSSAFHESNTFPVFIVGADRSGTTMLRLMLNEHRELLVARETWFMIDLMNALPLVDTLTQEQRDVACTIITGHPRWQDLEIEGKEFVERVSSLARASLADVIATVFELLLEREGKSRWGDKTPEYVVAIGQIHAVFPHARFIHVIRDARDVCLSLLQKRWRGPHARNVARYWADYVGRGITCGRALPNGLYLEVNYEDLVRNTEMALKRICEFVDLDYAPSMMQFYESAERHIAPWEREHHQKTMRRPSDDDLGRWRRSATILQVAVIESLAGEVMEAVGQQRHYRGASRFLIGILRIAEELFYRLLRLRRRFIARPHTPGRAS
jgi:hypothetical protein